MNYIELSIPYPQTLIVSTSYQTTPSEGEEYHGGGGASGGGVMSKDGGIGSGIYGTRDGGGNESERHTGYNADVVLREVTKNLMNMSVKAYPDDNGTFNAVFDLRAGIFIDGIYKLKANYFGHKYEDNFFVSDNSLKGGLKPQVLLDSDKDVYIPGEIVLLSGKIMNVYYYDSVSLIIEPPDISKTNCLIGQQCGFGNSEKKIRVNEGVEGATFFMNYKIPPTAELGTYTATADTHFGKVEKQFIIIDESELIGNVPPSDSSSIIPKKIIEKFNRITGNDIPIILAEKSFEESTLVPRVIQGSLFTSARGDESNVNIKVTTPGGECIIGQDSRCLISESTRKPGEIYSTVSIDNINYKIRYSGNDVRLEKFSIVPEDSNSKIDIDTWNVEIMKDNQPSRFYYKVSYVALE